MQTRPKVQRGREKKHMQREIDRSSEASDDKRTN